MATRKTKPVQTEPEMDMPMVVEKPVVMETKKPMNPWIVPALMVLALVFWWWKTNTWPVVAMAGGKIIFRHEIDSTLYSQYGQRTVEGIVTQYQIDEALNKKDVSVTDKEIDDKLAEIKTRLPQGTSIEEELKNQGMTMQGLRDLLKIQLRLNKISEPQASASADEIAKYVKDNAKMMTATTEAQKKEEAEMAIKQDKMNTIINGFVQEAQKSGSVWWWPTYKTVTPTPAPAAGQ